MRLKIGSMLIVMLMLAACEKDDLDRQMDALCKLDGGSKVYEKVALPASMFDESGYPFPGWRDRLGREDRLNADYLYVRNESVLKSGDPFKGEGRLRRVQVKIVRKSDSKVLGETVGYFRGGGDGVVIGQPTSNSCPKEGAEVEKLVFVKK